MEKRFVNCGSAIIEMTFLIPILLGIVYLYIMLFLFLMESAKYEKTMVEALYSLQEENEESTVVREEEIENGNLTKSKQGSRVSVFVEEKAGMFDIELEMHRNEDATVDNIRRWQLAADTIRTGENE